MLNLRTDDVLYAKSTVTNVAYTLSGAFGDANAVHSSFFQTVRDIYTAPHPVNITLLSFRNLGTDSTVLTVFLNGTSTRYEIFKAELRAGWSCILDPSGWKVYDTSGRQVITDGSPLITVSSTAPSNPSLGDLWVEI